MVIGIGTLAADGWAGTFGTASRGTGRAVALPSPLLAVPNVTAHPSTASVPTPYYFMWQYNCLRTLKHLCIVGPKIAIQIRDYNNNYYSY